MTTDKKPKKPEPKPPKPAPIAAVADARMPKGVAVLTDDKSAVVLANVATPCPACGNPKSDGAACGVCGN